MDLSPSNHPRSLWVVSFGILCYTFSYYGTQTILALYFITVFNEGRDTAYLLYGAYAAFAYSTPILGGIIADKWFGGQKTLLYGSMLNILGNLILISLDRNLFCIGLAFSLIGAGFYKSNAAHLVGMLYGPKDVKKESGYTWYYLFVNIGGTLGPLTYAFIVHMAGWHYTFLCSAIILSFAAFWMMRHIKHFTFPQPELNTSQRMKIGLSLLLLSAAILIATSFYLPHISNVVVILMFVVAIAYLIFAIKKYSGKARTRLISLLLICFFGMFFFAASLQVGATITVFIQSLIESNVIRIQLPASVFSTFYPFFVLVLAPVVTILWARLRMRNINPQSPAKLAMGISFAVLAMCVFALAAYSDDIVWIGIISGYMFLSAGELILTPAVYTAISDHSPVGMKSTMMASWMLFVGLGGYLSGVLASTTDMIMQACSISLPEYTSEFLLIAAFTMCVFVILLFCFKRMTRMLE